MGNVIGRRVWFDEEYRKIFPMLNVLLIGPSGTGKSTAGNIGCRLLEYAAAGTRPTIMNGGFSTMALHSNLTQDPHTFIYASELADTFSKQKHQENIVPYVTDLLDYKDYKEVTTKKNGIEIIKEPSVSILGCSTPEWLQSALPSDATGGGFLPRFLLVYEEHKSQKIALPGMHLSAQQRAKVEELRAEVFEEFTHITCAAQGEMPMKDYSVADYFTHWYIGFKPRTQFLAPFAERSKEFVIRLAMLIALSEHKTAIDQEDLEIAMRLYDWAMRRLEIIVTPTTQDGKLLQMVQDAVPIGEARSVRQITKSLRNFTTAEVVTNRLLPSLLVSGDLLREPDGTFKRVK